MRRNCSLARALIAVLGSALELADTVVFARVYLGILDGFGDRMIFVLIIILSSVGFGFNG